jgi:hypothetical protein
MNQYLRIKALFGTYEAAVKTRICNASPPLIVFILTKRTELAALTLANLQILSATLCERMPLDELLAQSPPTKIPPMRISR